ncbi:MBL fold hydrolase [Salipaludibacillus keqinensis]|uniref:MBL fold hydrolase n=1 Tax=Salipaludibacillus keqinensis TaxID=2045207 RepID=A0A323TDY8_9BACI|nr:N-acyl homoserine lactonase family protein [Salipaludibacillus keqinensis]PYZ93341.1 MBL fold hydrolase [Salipaludibacillus keqinensis]
MNRANDYEVFAIRYATREAKAKDNFYGHYNDIHEDRSMPMDYYVWLIKSDQHTILVDTGFTEKVGNKRGREFLRAPVDSLRDIGINGNDITHVILTHMHYDHIGNLDSYPNATFVVQDSEMAFWTGRYASKPMFLNHIESEDVVYLVRENLKNKLKFVDGNEEIFPGVNVYKTGGHSAGLQIVTVETSIGRVVLASDAAHYYENLNLERPFSTIHDLENMYKSFDMVRYLSDDPNLIIPGHDPLVMKKFPKYSDDLEGLVVRIK